MQCAHKAQIIFQIIIDLLHWSIYKILSTNFKWCLWLVQCSVSESESTDSKVIAKCSTTAVFRIIYVLGNASKCSATSLMTLNEWNLLKCSGFSLYNIHTNQSLANVTIFLALQAFFPIKCINSSTLFSFFRVSFFCLHLIRCAILMGIH